ncbi:MAG: hypothetical protein Kow0069_29900 [Promethearchaeota archaeon]
MAGKDFLTQVVSDEVLQALSLQNRYQFLNENLRLVFSDEEMEFLRQVEAFCLEYEKKADHSEASDLYAWYPEFGAEGLICRYYDLDWLGARSDPHGMVADFARHLALDFFDPQFSWSIDASVLSVNPLVAHHENVEVRVRALERLVKGQAVGCICITEPERGSDATHMLTTCERTEAGGLRVSGTKAFNTNAPKAHYAVVYATEVQNDPNAMTQVLVELPNERVHVERVMIPWAPRVHLGKEEFRGVDVAPEAVIAPPGRGKAHLFEGLVVERLGIALLNNSESWNAVTHAAIYSSVREQMGKKILRHQAVGFLLSELWARTANLTRALLNFCRTYDALVEKHSGELPADLSRRLAASASQLKFDCASANQRTCYEVANLMGGAGVCDNTRVRDLLGVSRVQEIVGGTRQIQQYIMTGTIESILRGR